jgi:hypothetical protein
MIATWLGKRTPTMQRALDTSVARGGRTIIETGCARMADSWEGDGMSTLVFGEHVTHCGGWLWTVDNDAVNLATAMTLSQPYRSRITYSLGDSVAFLRAFGGPIDLLYLDSLDYPYGTLLDLYGGRDDIAAAEATLAAMSEAEIVDRHGDLISPSQEHAVAELRAASLHAGSLVLIDDADLPGGGKARLAKHLLAERGATCLAEGYQSLWSVA